MIEYNFLSRNVSNPKKFKEIRDERIIMKRNKDKRQEPRKIVLNSTFGASKDKYNKLYDPLQANNLCISNQLFLVDLLEKLENKCQIIQSNTDGVLLKLYQASDKKLILDICHEWEQRTRFELEYDEYVTVIQSNVNNYIIIDKEGNIKRKGSYVKKLSKLDNDLPIVNKAIVDYFTKHIPVKETIMNSNQLIDFQKITKISSKYEFGFKENFNESIGYQCEAFKTVKGVRKYDGAREYNGHIVHEKVYRCFASLDENDGSLYKKKKDKVVLDKTGGTPNKCFIINDDIRGMELPAKLDKQWYIDLAEKRVKEFCN